MNTSRWISKKGDLSSHHYNDGIMGAMASQITSITIVYSTIYSSSDQRKHQSSASLEFVRGIHRWPVNSPHKWPATRKMIPFDDVFMITMNCGLIRQCRVTHVCAIEQGHHWFRQWLVTYSTSNHYSSQCRLIVNETIREKISAIWIKIHLQRFPSMKWIWQFTRWWSFCLGLDVPKYAHRKVKYLDVCRECLNSYLIWCKCLTFTQIRPKKFAIMI